MFDCTLEVQGLFCMGTAFGCFAWHHGVQWMREVSWSICREPSELTRDPGSGHGSHDGAVPRGLYRALLVIHLMFGYCVPLRAAVYAVRPCV